MTTGMGRRGRFFAIFYQDLKRFIQRSAFDREKVRVSIMQRAPFGNYRCVFSCLCRYSPAGGAEPFESASTVRLHEDVWPLRGCVGVDVVVFAVVVVVG